MRIYKAFVPFSVLTMGFPGSRCAIPLCPTKRLYSRMLYFLCGFIFVASLSYVVFKQSTKNDDRFRYFSTAALYAAFNKNIGPLDFLIHEQPDPINSYPDKLGAIARGITLEEKRDNWELVNENTPELPVLLRKRSNGPTSLDSKCAQFPDLYRIRFNNVHWQMEETDHETYFFYSAFLDIREQISKNSQQPYENTHIRVLGVKVSERAELINNNTTLKVCQLWFKFKKTPVFGLITNMSLLWEKAFLTQARLTPFLLTCQIPPSLNELPISVSLVPEQCTNATHNLNIIHRERAKFLNETLSSKQKFAVCVKALDLPDPYSRDRLIEWIETLLLLGADKIFFYEFYVDPAIKKVLNYYENKGIVGVMQTTLPGELPNQSQLRHLYIRGRIEDKRLTELIPYNDCFLRNMYDYRYIAVMDIDEVFVPVENISWSDLINQVLATDIGLAKMRNRTVTSFCFRNFYFLDGMMDGKENEVSHISPNFHMLRHIYRSVNSTGWNNMKCFHSSHKTLGLHNHFAFFCSDGLCNRHNIDETRGQLNHYRSKCYASLKENKCKVLMNKTIKDTKLWRFKTQIVNRIKNVNKFLRVPVI